MNLKASTQAAAGLTATIVVLTMVNILLWAAHSRENKRTDGTYQGSRPPHCDPTFTNRHAVPPTPTAGTSNGYDWVAANYALNIFQEGARAYAMNEKPVPFPRTKTVALLSGTNTFNPNTVADQRLQNIAWVVKLPGKGTSPDLIWVIFRGTQSNPEWGISALAQLVPWHPDYPGVQVHFGYNTAINEIKNRLYDALRSSISNPNNTVVYLTGLSLGGSLSTVAAADLVTRSDLGLKDVRLYAFSAPRVGNGAFVDMMKRANMEGKLKDMFTIVNAQDLIHAVPPESLGYAPMPALTFSADWGDGTNNHLSAVQMAHIDRVSRKCPAVVPYPIKTL